MSNAGDPTCSGVESTGERCGKISVEHRVKDGYFCKEHRAQASWLFDTDSHSMKRRERHATGIRICCGLTKQFALCKKVIGTDRKPEGPTFCTNHIGQCPESHWKLSRGTPDTGDHDDEVYLQIRERLLKFVEFRNFAMNPPQEELSAEGPSSVGAEPELTTQACSEVFQAENKQRATSGYQLYLLITFMLVGFFHAIPYSLIYSYLLYIVVEAVSRDVKRGRAWVRAWWRIGGGAAAHAHTRADPRSPEDQTKAETGEEAGVEDNTEKEAREAVEEAQGEAREAARETAQEGVQEEVSEDAPVESGEETGRTGEGEEQSTPNDASEPQPPTSLTETSTQSGPGEMEWREAFVEYEIALKHFLDTRWSEDNPASFDRIPWPVFRRMNAQLHSSTLRTTQPSDLEQEVTNFIKAMTKYDNALLRKCQLMWHPDKFSTKGIFLSIRDPEERDVVQSNVTMISQCINAALS
ncbi:hypothetical protein PM082_017666 [Marasmius tenuissimus]|nr:hypothetical protein PM082_017666 [Marasmius tenuissimus]